MLETITSYYFQFSSATKDNPILAGAVSVWGLSVITYLVRNIPAKVYHFLKNQSTTSLSVSNAGNDGNQHRLNLVLAFITKQKGIGFSRSLKFRTETFYSWDTEAKENVSSDVIQPGFSINFFIWKGRLFWYRREPLVSTGTNLEKENLIISTYGRSHRPFYDLVEAAFPPETNTEIKSYRFSPNQGWVLKSTVPKRQIETVIIASSTKERIMSSMERFMASEDWYLSRGISYKETYLLHGPTGTGKTSLIKALISHFDLPVYEIDLSQMSNNLLMEALSSLPKRSACIIEDFDGVDAINRRSHLETHDGEDKEGTSKEKSLAELFSGSGLLTLSGVLNALDGFNSLHGCMIFLTTNTVDRIDPAMLRKGRMDEIHYLGWLTDKEIKEYIKLVAPGYKLHPDLEFHDMPGCDVYAAFKDNRADPIAFIDALPKKFTFAQLSLNRPCAGERLGNENTQKGRITQTT